MPLPARFPTSPERVAKSSKFQDEFPAPARVNACERVRGHGQLALRVLQLTVQRVALVFPELFAGLQFLYLLGSPLKRSFVRGDQLLQFARAMLGPFEAFRQIVDLGAAPIQSFLQ